MSHKCFISYKKEDVEYKKELVALFDDSQVIDKSLDRIIDSEDGDYIIQKIREDYLKDSTVTILLIGTHSSENEGVDWFGREKNYFIKREMQASLYNGKGNTRNGILGIVLPDMYDNIFKGKYSCNTCGNEHNWVAIDDNTVIKEFSANYYIEKENGCAWSEDERYCVLVKWDDFVNEPEEYIEKAFQKRSTALADKVKVRIPKK